MAFHDAATPEDLPLSHQGDALIVDEPDDEPELVEGDDDAHERTD